MDHQEAVAARRASLHEFDESTAEVKIAAIQQRLDAATDLRNKHFAEVSGIAHASTEDLDSVASRRVQLEDEHAAELDAEVLRHQMELESVLARRDSKVDERKHKAATMSDVAAARAKAELRADIHSSAVELDAERRDLQASLVDDRRESIVANVKERQGHLQNFAVPSVESKIE